MAFGKSYERGEFGVKAANLKAEGGRSGFAKRALLSEARHLNCLSIAQRSFAVRGKPVPLVQVTALANSGKEVGGSAENLECLGLSAIKRQIIVLMGLLTQGGHLTQVHWSILGRGHCSPPIFAGCLLGCGAPWWDLRFTLPQQPAWDHAGRYGHQAGTGRAETGKRPGS